MKKGLIIIITLAFFACNRQVENTKVLQNQIDSLQSKLDNTYKPGFGEFMSSIQIHHNRLWFAGQNQNWKLADFEINEIKESIADIKEFCKDRTETKFIGMIEPAMDSLSNAIQQKNPARFKNSFEVLTTNCNACHQATNHEYNVIKIPDVPPFSNQVFKVNGTK
jgi:hypothetical protein